MPSMPAAPHDQGGGSETMRTPTVPARPVRDASEVDVTERRDRCLRMVLLTNGGLPERPSIGQLPQDVQGTVNVTGQRDGVQRLILRRQGLLLVGREPAGDQDPLVRGLGRIVALEDLAPDPPFALQLA